MSKNKHIPPLMAQWLLKKFFLKSRSQDSMGDLEEFYLTLSEEKGKGKANRWYWGQVFKSIPYLIHNLFFWGRIMFSNYSLIAVRNLVKNKLYSVINILGLAVGLACCLFIYMYISNELSYDTFHDNYERVYRVPMMKKTAAREARWGVNTVPLAPELQASFPEVEIAGRITDFFDVSVVYEDKVFPERINHADSEFLTIYKLDFIRGEQKNALSRPETAVITTTIANKYFGQSNPIGKKLKVGENYFEITAVVADVPENSHMDFDILLSLITQEEVWWYTDWPTGIAYTYVKLAKGSDPGDFESKIKNYAHRYEASFGQEGIEIVYWLQPIADIHLYSDLDHEYKIPGNPLNIYIFFGVGMLILFIACMNFINLSTAKSTGRAKEVGVRKAIGADKKQLLFQFLYESVLITFIASIIALIIVSLSLEGFNHLTGVAFSFNQIFTFEVFLFFLLFSILIGISSGIYPAVFISSFNPVYILKGLKIAKSKGAMFRKVLVVSQFTISIVLIISTLIIFQQIDYMQNSDLGFDKERKLVLVFPENGRLAENYEEIKSEFSGLSQVAAASASSHLPGREFSSTRIYLKGKESETGMSMQYICSDYDFNSVFDLEILAGRFHQKDMGADTARGSLVLNEAAIKAFGFNSPQEAINSYYWNREVPLIGVVKNFHVRGLQESIEPLYMVINPRTFRYLTLNLNAGNTQRSVRVVEEKFKELFPNEAFEYFFVDTDFNNQYMHEEKMGNLFRTFTFLGLFIACLGLFGLSSFMVERRFKEIGIRKVLGASVSGIVNIISREFMILISIANLIAWPIGYFTMKSYLQNFAFATGIYLDVFLIAMLIALIVAFLTISSQSLKAAYMNPVKTLKYE